MDIKNQRYHPAVWNFVYWYASAIIYCCIALLQLLYIWQHQSRKLLRAHLIFPHVASQQLWCLCSRKLGPHLMCAKHKAIRCFDSCPHTQCYICLLSQLPHRISFPRSIEMLLHSVSAIFITHIAVLWVLAFLAFLLPILKTKSSSRT
jgi:hypothetical protein